MLQLGMALSCVGPGSTVSGATDHSLRADRRSRLPSFGIGGMAVGLSPEQNSQPRSSSARAPQTMQVVRCGGAASGDSRRLAGSVLGRCRLTARSPPTRFQKLFRG
jgi:hypothetical protein